jgi:hypothetical protein
MGQAETQTIYYDEALPAWEQISISVKKEGPEYNFLWIGCKYWICKHDHKPNLRF